MPPLTIHLAQIAGISSSFLAAGGMVTLSIFDFPELRAQPGERSLPAIRWLFSHGSHIFPQAAFLSTAAFTYLSLVSLRARPSSFRTLSSLPSLFRSSPKASLYLAAALFPLSIMPFTRFVMLQNNFALMAKNEELGGARSALAAEKSKAMGYKGGERSVEESIGGKGEADEFKDNSLAQEKTAKNLSGEEQEEVREMIKKFEGQNLVRAGLIGVGGVVGIIGATI